MASRKRPRQDEGNANGHHDQNNNNDSRGNINKKSKKSPKPPQSHHKLVQYAVLVQYYSQIQTLRNWLVSKLPKSSKIRRRKLANLGLDASSAGKTAWSEDEIVLGALLDNTLVAVRHVKSDEVQGESEEEPDHRWQKWIAFSQGCGGDESYVTLSGGDGREAAELQAEMVDYVIWLLFSREIKPGTWPKHMLCDGFRKSPTSRPQQQPQHQGSFSIPGSEKSTATMPQPNIPGVFQLHQNHCVKALKESPWPQLLTLLGQSGQRIMLDLLVDCSIFVAVKAGRGNYNQLTGIQMSEMDPLTAVGTAPKGGSSSKYSDREKAPASTLRQPSEITFVRSRMMYARAALNARGNVHFGLRHIHVLNRFPRTAKAPEDSKNGQDTDGNSLDPSVVHIMMYMFPRQFGLHNVFTSIVDRQKTAQKLQDYTLREEEIGMKYPKTADGQAVKHVPKRLRGKLPELVKKLQVLHERCSYSKMLQYYCPVGLSQDTQNHEPTTTQKTSASETAEEEDHGVHGDGVQPTQNRSLLLASRPLAKPTKKRRQSRQATGPAPVTLHYDNLVDLATPVSSISAFCQAVLSKIIPGEFWGRGSIQEHNKSLFLKRVHEFIFLRRFESMCLHQLMQGMKITDIEWLTPPKLGVGKCSQSDFQKRTEIFYEFLYYLFDSLLIPLIRSNFYVTESNTHRYKLFFFRHDIWRQIAEPAMATLKASMFEEVRLSDAMRILGSRKLGYSQIRLLPKRDTMRPIMNLRRRTVLQGNKKFLGPSINTVLGPVSEVLKLEKSLRPDRLGAAMFSVGDIYHRIKAFKTKLLGGGDSDKNLPKLYFAKVDVQAAFDTIPQDAMVKLLNRILQESRYKISKHAEVQPLESNSSAQNGKSSLVTKTFKRWHSTAKLTSDLTPFSEAIEASTTKKNKKDTIFVGSALERYLQTRDILALAGSHIKENLVKVGKKYYRQKRGIPQGSVLSSLLCSYFYADLERRELGFLEESDGEVDGEGTLLMRLIDDFLLVTTDRRKAERFVQVMYEGFEEYGVKVRLEKSLVNFGMRIGGVEVPRVQPQRTKDGKENGQGRMLLPYCRVLIDCDSLDVGKQRDEGMLGGGDSEIFNSLTVEYSRCPGQNFKRKVLNAFKIQSHLMFFDTSHNLPEAVLRNAYTAFLETATKMWAYARCLPRENKPSVAVVRDTLTSLVDVAYLLLTSRSRKQRYPGYVCSLRKGQVAWLVYTAVGEVLGRKQAGYGGVIEWVRGEIGRLEMEAGGMDGNGNGNKDGTGRMNGLSALKRAVTEGGRGKYRGGL